MMSNLPRHDIYRFIGWFFLINALLFVLFGVDYLLAILNSGSLYINSFVSFQSFTGKAIVLVFAFLNYLVYMMLLGFIPGFLVAIAALIFPYKRLIWFLSVILGVLSLILLIADLRVFAMFKFHLNSTILTLVLSPEWKEFLDFSTAELVHISGLIVLFVLLQSTLAWVVWTRIIVPKRFKVGKSIVTFWLGGALFCYFSLMTSIAYQVNLLSQQTPNLPLYNQLFAYLIPVKNASDILLRYSEHHFTQPNFSNEKMNYPLHPLQCKTTEKPYNVILIMVDSLRFDALQSRYMPKTTEFGKKSWQFLHHMSGGNATQPGLFSLFYSLPINYWTAVLKQNKPPVFMEVLQKANYTLKIIWSMSFSVPEFDKTIFQTLKPEEMIHIPMDSRAADRDRQNTNLAIQFLKNHPSSPFFLYLFYDSAHAYCADQNVPQIFQPVSPCVRMIVSNSIDPKPYFNRYLNTVSFLDGQVGKVLETLEEEGYLENSVVIFTSDHGQEFNDNNKNYWDHAGNFTPVQTQVPFLIYWPHKNPRQVNELTSSYDVVPTLLQELLGCENPTTDYSIGKNLFDPAKKSSYVIMGSYANVGIYEPLRITTLEASGRVIVTDLKGNLLDKEPPINAKVLEGLEAMRKYFVHTKS